MRDDTCDYFSNLMVQNLRKDGRGNLETYQYVLMPINVIIARGILSEYRAVCCLIFNDGCTRIRATTTESMQDPERHA